MYHHLRGAVIHVLPGRVVLEVNGVGWDLLVPLSTSCRLAAGREALLLTHLIVREDAHILYGFLTEEERSLFRTLIGLTGIGAATAAQILSAVTPQEFIVAVEKQDTSFLKKIKGIGDKTAKRMILELKGSKTLLPDLDSGSSSPSKPAGIAGDAVMALETMGMQNKEAVARVEKVLASEGDLTLEELIRRALRV